MPEESSSSPSGQRPTAAARLGAYLRQLREERGYSLRQLSELLGLRNHGDISLWETGQRPLPERHIDGLGRALGGDPDRVRALYEDAVAEQARYRALRAIGFDMAPSGAVTNVDSRERTPNFAGREAELALIGERFAEAAPAGSAQIISGLAGVGKTQLALHYAFKRANDYELIWRVVATETAAIPTQLTMLAEFLHVETRSQNAADTAAAVADALGRRARWLLVIDDAREPDDIRWMCATDQGGHVIVTSRYQSWRALGSVVSLEPLPIEVSTDFLIARAGTRAGDPGAIAEALGGLPLALEQAGALLERHGWSFSEYTARLSRAPTVMLQAGEPAYATGPVAQTLGLAVREAVNAVPGTMDVLDRASVLGDAPIPTAILLADGEDVVTALCERSLASWRNGDVVIHRVLRHVVRGALRQIDTVTSSVAQTLLSCLPDEADSAVSRERFASLVPHVVAIADHSTEANADIGACLSRCGAWLAVVGQFDAAERFLRRAVDVLEQCGASAWLADARHNLGNVLMESAPGDEAISLFDAAVEHWRLCGERLKAATTSGMLGRSLVAVGRGDEGVDCLRQAVADAESDVGSEHPWTLMLTGNLASALELTGSFAESTTMRIDAWKRAERALGPNDPVTISFLVELAHSTDPRESHATRLEFAERAIEARSRVGVADDETQESLLRLKDELSRS